MIDLKKRHTSKKYIAKKKKEKKNHTLKDALLMCLANLSGIITKIALPSTPIKIPLRKTEARTRFE